ncbi:MAG: EamA family transporter [Candidatus Goldiibacteriota bacterium]
MKAFFLAVITAFFWGIVPIIEKIALDSKIYPAAGVVYRTIGSALGGLVLFAFLMSNENTAVYFKNITYKTGLILIAAGIIASVVGQIFFYNALQSGHASVAAPVAGAFPLVTFVLGVLLLGEAVTVQKVIGVLLVISGVILLK